VMVTDVPTGPNVGLTLLICRTGMVTVKLKLLLA